MSRGWTIWLVASVGGIALIAAACAPASEPASQQPTSQQPSSQAPQQKAPEQQKQPETKQPASQTAQQPSTTKPAVSISGIPLDPDAVRGGTLLTSASAEGPTMNTWEEASGNSFNIVHPVSNMVVSRQRWGTKEDYEAGAYWNITPDLAQSWEQSQDGLRWTFKLQDGVKWSDATPLTCADTKWSLDTIRTGEGLRRSPRAVHFVAIDSIECPDDLTMVVKLKRPKPGLLEVIGLPYNVVRPKHIYGNDTNALREKAPAVGTGPFTVKERIPGEKTVLARRADYWDQPLPYLDAVEMRILNTQSQLAGLRAGRLDIGGSTGNFAGGQANQLLKECNLCQVWPKATHPGLLFSLMPNFSRPPWNNPELRDVLSLAVDRKKLIQVGYDGWGQLGTGGIYLPKSFWAMPYERVKKIPGYDFENVEANRQKARELLKKAGYNEGELKLDVVYSVGGLNYQSYAIPTIEDLNTTGIVATGKPLETALYYDTMTNGAFDVGGHAGWIGGFDPDFILYEYFYSGSDRNYGRYANPEFDRLVDLQSVTLDPQERRNKAWDAAEIVLRDQVRVMGGFQDYQPIFGSRVRGFMPAVPSQANYGPWQRHDRTWLTEK